MVDNEFIDILKRILKENKELKKNIDMLEKILHLSLPVIESDSSTIIENKKEK